MEPTTFHGATSTREARSGPFAASLKTARFRWPFTMAVHNGMLYTAHKSAPVLTEDKGARVFAYDGERWEDVGVPLMTHSRCAEIHCLDVFGGAIHAGTNPLGRVVKLDNGVWRDVGELGDSREPTAFASYNGKFYAGSLQWADVYRQDGDD